MLVYKKIKSLYNNKFKSEFLRNTVTLMTGTTISQFIPIITAPIITRMYLPEYYGVMGIYMSISGLLGIISTLAYTNAILLPEKDEDAISVLHLCMVSTLVWTALIAILTIFFHNKLAILMNAPEVATYLFLLPLSVLAGGWGNAFAAWANRTKHYRIISSSRVMASIFTAVTSISIGFILKGPTGLIIGLLVNQITVPLMLYYQIYRSKIKILPFKSKAELIMQAKLYSNFPKYSLPSDFINNFINQLPVYLLGIYAGKAEVGHYNLSNRILGLPISFISSAVGDVFKQKASSDYAINGNCRPVFIKTFKTLFVFSIIPFIILIFFAPHLFSFVFGSHWKDAGVYTQIMGIMFFVRFTVSPLTFVYMIANKQNEDLFWHFYMVLTTFLCFYLGYRFFHSSLAMLLLFSLNYTIIYIIYFFRSLSFSKGK